MLMNMKFHIKHSFQLANQSEQKKKEKKKRKKRNKPTKRNEVRLNLPSESQFHTQEILLILTLELTNQCRLTVHKVCA